MLKPLISFREIESLIPNTGIQFLDFGFDIEALRSAKIARHFCPIDLPRQTDEHGFGLFHLRMVEENEDSDWVALATAGEETSFIDEPDDVYKVDAAKAIEQYTGIVLPMPYLRRGDPGPGQDEAFADGPSNWARLHITELPERDVAGNTHRVVMAFDTKLKTRNSSDPYAAPVHEDVKAAVFSLVSDPLLNRGFLASDWVRSWLRSAFADRLSLKRGRKISSLDLHDPEQFEKRGEYWAAYHMVLLGLAEVCRPPQLQFVDTISPPQPEPVEVDVMIDIGNSRTCGMLVEEIPERGRADISKTQRLEVRDLSRLEQVYSEPIQSWVEFFPARFGYTNMAPGQKRTNRPAFFWPSPVRIGPEAARLAVKSDGTEGVTGMPSPKRYLWDREARAQSWANNPSSAAAPGEPTPPIKSEFTQYLTESGEPLGKSGLVGMHPRYSRSSIFMFLVAELLLHVVAQINSVSARGQNEYARIPRRLRTIALTLPSATPVAEQRIMKEQAKNALDLVWKAMGWPVRKRGGSGEQVAAEDALFLQPDIKLDWDEASCTHAVYLYNEVLERYGGAPSDWFSLVGRRKTDTGAPAIRVASIDIGGGTTDLVIIQHECEGRSTIHPRQLLREGFRQAGDDVVKSVSEECVVPAITEALLAAGASAPHDIMPELFGSERDDFSAAQRNRRALFVNQIIAPVATGLLERFEQVDLARPGDVLEIPLRELLSADSEVGADIAGFVNAEAANRGASGFDIFETTVPFDERALRRVISSTVKNTLEHLCDLVRAYDCDALILTGRPSRLPVIRDIVSSQAPVPPHRIVSLHDYEIGQWYPFRDVRGRISDPKTTVVVGAMLCKVCEGSVEGFFLRASELRMWSTARFVGPMGKDDMIRADDVCLEDLSPEDVTSRTEFKVQMDAPFFVGFRQLPLARWPASPLLYVYFKETGAGERLHPPYTLTFERKDPRDDENIDHLNQAMEDYRLVEVEDRNGDTAMRLIEARLQTLRTEGGAGASYWLDSGILDLRTGMRRG